MVGTLCDAAMARPWRFHDSALVGWRPARQQLRRQRHCGQPQPELRVRRRGQPRYDALERMSSLRINGAHRRSVLGHALNQRAMKRTAQGDARWLRLSPWDEVTIRCDGSPRRAVRRPVVAGGAPAS